MPLPGQDTSSKSNFKLGSLKNGRVPLHDWYLSLYDASSTSNDSESGDGNDEATDEATEYVAIEQETEPRSFTKGAWFFVRVFLQFSNQG